VIVAEQTALANSPAADTVSEAVRPSLSSPWYHVRPIFLITLLATILRFALLSQPVLWGDEALVYLRVAFSYRDMLDTLLHDSFAPLHYELYWCIARAFHMTPIVMRLVPAISGILMVPAIYWLARQLCNPWAANCAALFTACSAFVLGYSRDAKMYMDFWLFCTLSVACLLWWLRSGGESRGWRGSPARWRWWGWTHWACLSWG